MNYLKIVIVIAFITSLYSQDIRLEDDYTYFGRKQPLSLGSAFSALGTSPILVNPANIAYMTDNRISVGGTASGVGYGYYISWLAPNFSINNAKQVVRTDEAWTNTFKKNLLQFNFGLSSGDLGLKSERFSLALGVNVNHLSDYLYDDRDLLLNGGEVNTIDFGMQIKWNVLVLEVALLNLNQPEIKDSGFTYEQGIVFGGRYENAQGLKISLQGLTGEYFSGTDFGLNIAAEQRFFERRLVPRLQLTSYYKGAEAVMQNISCGLGYRLSSKGRMFLPLKDLELSYALSFLTTPHNIGTNMLVLSKYF